MTLFSNASNLRGPAFSLEFAGRFLMAAFFFLAAGRKIVAWNGTAAYFGSVGLPVPELTLLFVIVVEFGGALLLLIGWQIRWGALALALFTIAAAMIGHDFWNAPVEQYNNQINHFLKVIGILGGLLCIADQDARRSREY